MTLLEASAGTIPRPWWRKRLVALVSVIVSILLFAACALSAVWMSGGPARLLAIAAACSPASAQTVLRDRRPEVVQDGRVSVFLAYAPRFTLAEHRRVFVYGETRQGDFAVPGESVRGASPALSI